MKRDSESRIDVRAVLFDLDDTLYPEQDFLEQVFPEICDVVAKELRIPNEEVLRHLWGLYQVRSKRIFTQLVEVLCSTENINQDTLVRRLIRAYREAGVKELGLYPDVMPCFQELKLRNIRIGIVTNGHPPLQKRKLERLGIEPLLDVVVFANEYIPKPAPEGFFRAAEALSLEPELCLFVGDRIDIDIEGALKAGMYAIWVHRLCDIRCNELCKGSIHRDYHLKGSSCYVGSVTTLLDILNSIHQA